MAEIRIGVLLGDDIGLEVIPLAVKVMDAAASRAGLDVRWMEFPIGRLGHDRHGHTFPEVTREGLADTHGFITGPIGHNSYPRGDDTWMMPPLRKHFDLFASVKPVRSYPNLPSLHENVDIIFLREVTEGMLYSETVVAGAAEYRPNDEITIASRVITRKGSNRVAREAFEIARGRGRRKVTASHKEPVYRLACGMFAEECRKVASEYPDIEFEEMLIDTTAAKLVSDPHRFDVVVTTNQFGDILTDIGGALVGSLGLAPGLCVGHDQAMAQATHGSAPDIACRNVANPYALIMSGQMLIEWIGRRFDEPKATEAAACILEAVDGVILDGRHITADLGGKASTTEMADAILERVRG